MSQIVVEIPIEALGKPNVARALSELTLALGGHAVAPAPAPAPRAVPVTVEAYAAAPLSSDAEPARRPNRPRRPAEEPTPEPVRHRSARTRRAPAPPPPAPDADETQGAPSAAASERWKKYVANLPENSRRFLELLEKHGQLTVNEAVEKLNLPGPKAMGGLTGAMARWAPKQGVQIPYEARETADGVRYWVWKGIK